MRPTSPQFASRATLIAAATATTTLLLLQLAAVATAPANAAPLSVYDDLVSGSRAFLRMIELFDSVDDDGDDANYDSASDYQERQQPQQQQQQQSVRTKPSRSTDAAASSGNGGGGSAAERCTQPVRKGVCRALIPRWSYDAASKECREFKFGGCDGNGNNFASLRQCRDMCGGL